MEAEFPRITRTLIDRLNEACPEKCPTPDMSLEEIHHYAGKRAMVNFLTEIYEDQNNNES
tara:strand:- start:5790 stop:5969 length:180 start_codon:yes stop_codon:yes gene_type:complete